MTINKVLDWYIKEVKEEFSFGTYAFGTFCILLGSWFFFCTIYSVIIRTGKFEHLKCQPKEKTNGKIFWEGCKDSFNNWVGILGKCFSLFCFILYHYSFLLKLILFRSFFK